MSHEPRGPEKQVWLWRLSSKHDRLGVMVEGMDVEWEHDTTCKASFELFH